ncbi:MAG: hypothetical protein ABL997_19285 [Planctomycetota bacterium]
MSLDGMHKDGDERFADWVDGRMSPRDRERFEAEMRVSKPLRERAEAYRKTAQSVHQAFSQPIPKLDIADAVLARLSDPTRGPSRPVPIAIPRSLPSAWWRSGLVAAATIVLIVVLERWQPSASREESAANEATAKELPPTDRLDAATPGSELYLLKRDGDTPGEPGLSRDKSAEQLGAGRAEGDREELDRNRVEEVAEGGVHEQASNAPAAPEPDTKVGLFDKVEGSRFGSADGRVPPPVDTPKTMVPRVVLRLLPVPLAGKAKTESEAVRRGAAKDTPPPSPDSSRNGFLLGGFDELDKSLGNLQVQRLPAVPGDLGRTSGDDRAGSPSLQAWLVEGKSADVYAFLGRLSETGRAQGYEVTNGEVAMAEVLAFAPALPAPTKSRERVGTGTPDVPGSSATPTGPASPGPAGPGAGPAGPGVGAGGAGPGGAAPDRSVSGSATPMRLVIVIDSGSK